MLGWFRKQTGKMLHGEQEEPTARSVDRCLSELSQLRQDLDRELKERTWSVDKIVIEKLQADKVELNLDSLDIGEVSGMLSIGFNYGGRLIKVDSKGGGKTGQQPPKNPNRQKKPTAGRGTAPADKGKAPGSSTHSPVADRQPAAPHTTAGQPPNGRPGPAATRPSGEPGRRPEGARGAAARAGPHLTIRFN